MLLRRLVVAGLASTFAIGSIVACNNILGIQDVQPKSTTTSKKDTGTDPDPGDPTPPQDEGQVTPTRPNVFQVVLGNQHTCARKVDGTVRCWGDDTQGQLGGGTLAADGFVSSPQAVPLIKDAIDIAAGSTHTCIVHKDGKVSCWGFDLDGQLGHPEPDGHSATPLEVQGLTGAIAVTAGGNFTCAIRNDTTVACWGANGSGQLGTGDDKPKSTPVPVPGLNDVVSIAAGLSHVCAAKSSGGVVCWGDGQLGQLGQAGGSQTPVAVGSITNAVMVAAGERWSCAVLQTGAVMCWGANEHGQLGNGSSSADPTPTPVAVTNLTDAIALSGGTNHMCAARKVGSVACWGGGGHGQLGDGTARAEDDPQGTFVLADKISTAAFANGGGDHSCATTTANEVFCWGANDRGQLGTASQDDSPTPAAATLP